MRWTTSLRRIANREVWCHSSADRRPDRLPTTTPYIVPNPAKLPMRSSCCYAAVVFRCLPVHGLGSHDFDFLRNVQFHGFETSKPSAALAGPHVIVELGCQCFDTLHVIAGGDNCSTAKRRGDLRTFVRETCAATGVAASATSAEYRGNRSFMSSFRAR